MMHFGKGNLLAVLSCLFLVGGVSASQLESYQQAKVGEWVKYKMTGENMGMKLSGTITQKVTAKDDKSITIEITTEMMGQKQPPESKTMTFEELKEMGDRPMGAPESTKFEKVKEGDETVKVGEKSYKTHWVEYKLTIETPIAGTGTTKVWTCSEIPLGGMVRVNSDMDMSMGDQKIKAVSEMELVETGQ